MSGIQRTATLSPDGCYRWTLSRRWGDGEDVLWIMLNPSTADAARDDPTIRRIMKLSDGWGYGGLCVVNLYPFRSSSPAECRRWAAWKNNGPDWDARDVLQKNALTVGALAQRAALTVAAWGAATWATNWAEQLIEDHLPERLFCLGTTTDGAPKHPLARGKHRVPDDVVPVRWCRP